jgi:hypothetical protein
VPGGSTSTVAGVRIFKDPGTRHARLAAAAIVEAGIRRADRHSLPFGSWAALRSRVKRQ